MPTDLHCPDCEKTYPAGPDEPWRCDCGHPLEFASRPLPDSPAPEFSNLDTRKGLWAFEDFIPIAREVTLGEGFTPLVSAPDWNASFKLEYVFPSGSFKDRGATTMLSRAAELGVKTVLDDSSGNAGAAVAQYTARAAVDARIYVPAAVKKSKLAAIERVGAEPVRVEGSRQDVTDACIEAVESGAGWYASHAWNPAFFAGTATFALEVAAQRGWSVPDTVVLPVGHGTLFLGAYRGFAALRDAGWTDAMPRLLGVQATGHAPIVAELGEETTGDNDVAGDENDAADGIQIDRPARGEQILAAIEATDGDALAVDTEETRAALRDLHRAGFYVEPTSAAAVAGLETYRERGTLDADADVVVPLTGSGLKT